ncbi:hypothetical protein Q3G72_027337 [Acer saccharum]|nr:hypothetical protein Q3G72_027337 [Acer saccharum]
MSRSSNVDASLVPPGAHSLLRRRTIIADPVMGNSLPSSSVKGFVSYADLFKAPPARVDIIPDTSVTLVLNPSIGKGCDISVFEVVAISSTVGANSKPIPNSLVVTSVVDYVVLTGVDLQDLRNVIRVPLLAPLVQFLASSIMSRPLSLLGP